MILPFILQQREGERGREERERGRERERGENSFAFDEEKTMK